MPLLLPSRVLSPAILKLWLDFLLVKTRGKGELNTLFQTAKQMLYKFNKYSGLSVF
jgi:hypothetical protein